MKRYVAIAKLLGIIGITTDLGIRHGFAVACFAMWALSSLEEIKGKA